MRYLSAMKLGAGLCASALTITPLMALPLAHDPAQEAGAGASNDADTIATAPMGQASGAKATQQGATRSPELDPLMQLVRDSTFEKRNAVIDRLGDSIEASKDEMESLESTAKELEPAARGRFEAAYDEATYSRNVLGDCYENLKKAGADDWEGRKHRVVTALDLYSQAIDRVRTIASDPDHGG